MFKLAKAPVYWWPVEARIPAADDPGQFAEVKFEVQYRFLGNALHRALLDDIEQHKTTDRDVALRIVAGFRQVQDEAGSDIVFSPEALQQLVDVSGIDEAVVREYFVSRYQAKEKNSQRPPAFGQEAASPSTKGP